MLTDEARKKYIALFGREPKVSPTDPAFMDILQNEIFGEVFSTGVLSDQERERLTVIALSCLQTLPQLKAHLQSALHIGVDPVVLKESIYVLAPYIGYPKTLNAIGVCNEVFQEKGISVTGLEGETIPYEKREEEGKKIQVPYYGEEVKEVFSSLPEPFSTFVPHLLSAVGFGDFETRKILSSRQLEMTTLIALVSISASAQIKPHIHGALLAGNSMKEITASIVQVLPYVGFPAALSALLQVVQYSDENTEAYR